LEVAQIARTISRALNLNEDLTEAIALGHDLGHTPFGHLGEELLNQLSPLGFRHNEQSLRVVDVLEKDGQGLNLTWEVREGILNHSKTKVPILGEGWGKPQTLEGQVVKIADTIAYINHDIDDAIRAGLIAPTDLPSSAIEVLGKTHSTRIATMVQDVVKYSWAARGEGDLGQEKPSIEISLKVQQAANLLNEFLFDRVYNLTLAKEETQKAKEALNLLYQYFIEHPDKLPEENVPDESLERRVVDYIAGMTDNYALHLAEEIGG
jgi:dGTPase